MGCKVYAQGRICVFDLPRAGVFIKKISFSYFIFLSRYRSSRDYRPVNLILLQLTEFYLSFLMNVLSLLLAWCITIRCDNNDVWTASNKRICSRITAGMAKYANRRKLWKSNITNWRDIFGAISSLVAEFFLSSTSTAEMCSCIIGIQVVISYNL